MASDQDPASYTAMSTADVEAIGAHCQMAFCRQLDFLPFKCESCKGKYCLDHRTETAHACPKAGEWSLRREQERRLASSHAPAPKPTILNHEKQCAEPSCKTLIDTPLVTGIPCTHCNRRYCLKHRFQEDHDCKNLEPLGARSALDAQKDRGLAALSKLRAWGASKANNMTVPQTKSRATAAANLKAITDLKKTAKGEDKVAPKNRTYVHVEAEKTSLSAKIHSGKFFYDKEWSIGRILDMAAKSLQVDNVNNRGGGEAEKLRVFHVEGGKLLEFSDKLGACVKTGDTIILLRGVGPAAPDLIQM